MSLQEGAWVLWGLRVGMRGPVASFGLERGWELGFAFPPGDGAGSGQTPGAPCASLAPPMLHLLREMSLMGTDSIGHPTTGPDPALQLCSGCVFSLNPNIFLAQTPRNGAFLPQRARTSSAAGERCSCSIFERRTEGNLRWKKPPNLFKMQRNEKLNPWRAPGIWCAGGNHPAEG